MAINWNKRSYTKEEFIEAWNTSENIGECCRKLGLGSAGHHKAHEMTARLLGLTNDHMNLKSRDSSGNRTLRPLSEILVADSDYTNTANLRTRLIKEGLLEPLCVGCGRDKWVNFLTGEEEPMNLTLDHINGVNHDNRLENLRILCPTCHSYTPTFCGKNRIKEKIVKYCTCGASIGKNARSCNPCSNRRRNNRFEDVKVEEVIAGVKCYGYRPYAEMLGVSDNAVRKFLRRNGIDPLPKKIKE